MATAPLQDQLEQLPGAVLSRVGSADSVVRALPTHISDFGESPPGELEALLAEAALGADAAGAVAAAVPARAAAAAAGAGEEGDDGGALHLPSHISAFGDDLGPLSGGKAMLSASCGADDGFAAGGQAVQGGCLAACSQGLPALCFARLLSGPAP